METNYFDNGNKVFQIRKLIVFIIETYRKQLSPSVVQIVSIRRKNYLFHSLILILCIDEIEQYNQYIIYLIYIQ